MKNKILTILAIGIMLCLTTICYLFFKLGTIVEKKSHQNEITFVWDGLEKDIPEDGDQLINLSTNENVVHLNPADQ